MEGGLVRQLWDHALLAAFEGPTPQGARGAGAGPGAAKGGLAAAAALVERLGSQFYPSEAR